MEVVVGHQSGIEAWVEMNKMHNKEQYHQTIQQTSKHGKKEKKRKIVYLIFKHRIGSIVYEKARHVYILSLTCCHEWCSLILTQQPKKKQNKKWGKKRENLPFLYS